MLSCKEKKTPSSKKFKEEEKRVDRELYKKPLKNKMTDSEIEQEFGIGFMD